MTLQPKPYLPNLRPSLTYPNIYEDEKEDAQEPRAQPRNSRS